MRNKKKIFCKIKNFYNFLYFLPFILLIYILIKDRVIWNGERFDYYLNFYVCSISLFFIIFLFNLLKINIRQNILLILFSSYFSLIIVEVMIIGLDFIKTLNKQKYFNNKNIVKFNKNSLFEEYIKQYSENKNLQLKVWPKFFLNDNLEIFPLSSKSKSQLLYCNENGYYLNYITDRYGFNNKNSIWDSENIDYVFLGDSFIEGACVKPSQNISNNLMKITDKKILNLGQAGSGPLSQYATYLEYASKKKIKHLFFFYYEENDSIDLLHEKKNKILINYLKLNNYSQNLTDLKNNFKKDIIVKKYSDKRLLQIHKAYNHNRNKFIKLKRIITLHEIRNFIFRADFNIPIISEEYFDIVKKIHSISKEKNFDFTVVYLPSYSSINVKKKNNIEKNYRKIKNFLFTRNIRFIDLNKELFFENDKKKFFPFNQDGHYNEKGYEEVAKILKRLITNHQSQP